VTFVFVVVAVVAAFIPIRRAAGVNPTVALRCE
jgi:ABC-type lipoprotein release transport system permease subunit